MGTLHDSSQFVQRTCVHYKQPCTDVAVFIGIARSTFTPHIFRPTVQRFCTALERWKLAACADDGDVVEGMVPAVYAGGLAGNYFSTELNIQQFLINFASESSMILNPLAQIKHFVH